MFPPQLQERQLLREGAQRTCGAWTIKKEQIGSKWKITREKKALTSYQRVLNCKDISEQVKTQLKREHEALSQEN